jgi:MoaA/NifB/PqqE/SkfB family radical SAM enzyme
MLWSPQKLWLDIALTSRCPLRCRYCSVEKEAAFELTATQWIEVVESFAALRPIALISLEGGEPFLRKDLPEILAACLEVAGSVKVVTSGVLPLDLIPSKVLRHPRFMLELSLDGPVEIQDFLRDESWMRSWNFLRAGLERKIPMRLRSVISRYNVSIFPAWLMRLDEMLSPFCQRVGFLYDTILAPDALAGQGGEVPRARLRFYPTQGLLPSPAEMWALYAELRRRRFSHLSLLQTEPIRGCGAAEWSVISFDPSGNFSFCCESPGGMGSILQQTAGECLFLLESIMKDRPCKECPFLEKELCRGCLTGQKCGMVKHWGAKDCRSLYRSMISADPTMKPGKIVLSAES